MGFQIHSLKKRKRITSLMFLYDILRGRITEPNLLSRINIHVPRFHSRPKFTFYPPRAKTNMLANSVLSNVSTLYNDIGYRNPDIDIFHESRKNFIKALTEAIQN